MSVTKRESDIERYFVDRLKSIGVSAIKFIPDNMIGMPDRMILLPNNKVLWVELKTDNGRLAPMQEFRHQQLQKQGHTVYTIWNKQDVDNFVAMMSKQVHKPNKKKKPND